MSLRHEDHMISYFISIYNEDLLLTVMLMLICKTDMMFESLTTVKDLWEASSSSDVDDDADGC